MSDLPYRPNVGAALFNRDGQVLVARRTDIGRAPGADAVWQMPQGGIDADEDPRAAVMRELGEEIGIGPDDAVIIGEHGEWLQYDLPPELIGRALHGKYRGQRQRWFALRFLADDDAIRLDRHSEIEFDAWKWIPLAELPRLSVGFKTSIYETVARVFAKGSPLEPCCLKGFPGLRRGGGRCARWYRCRAPCGC